MLDRVTRSTTAAAQAAANTPSQISTSSGSHPSLTGPTSLQAGNLSSDYICLTNFQCIRQAYDNSCWAAVTAMAQQIVDPNPKAVFTEEALITKLAAWTTPNKTDARQTSVSLALKTANLKIAEETADKGSKTVRPAIETIYESISHRQPLVMCLTTQDQSRSKNITDKEAHYVLVTGCTEKGNIIEITNPGDGSKSLHKWNRDSGAITLTTDRYPGKQAPEVKSYYSSLTYYIEPPSPSGQSASASSSSTPANPSTSSSTQSASFSTSVSASSTIP